jgi:uncharacterized protein (DUF736 family)
MIHLACREDNTAIEPTYPVATHEFSAKISMITRHQGSGSRPPLRVAMLEAALGASWKSNSLLAAEARLHANAGDA